jgi:hypothetical protein
MNDVRSAETVMVAASILLLAGCSEPPPYVPFRVYQIAEEACAPHGGLDSARGHEQRINKGTPGYWVEAKCGDHTSLRRFVAHD